MQPTMGFHVISVHSNADSAMSHLVSDSGKVDQEKVGDRRCSFGAALAWEEHIEVFEELLGEADLAFSHAGGAAGRALTR